MSTRRHGSRLPDLPPDRLWLGTLGVAREHELHALLAPFHAAGGRWLDTGPVFGAGLDEGRVERWIGRWLRAAPKAGWRIASRYGARTEQGRWRGASHPRRLRDGLLRSLERLDRPHLDHLWCTPWDGHTPLEAIVEAMTRAHEEGLIGSWGFSDTPAAALARACAHARTRHLLPPSRVQLEHSLLARDPATRALCADQALQPVAWGLTAGGWLCGRPGRGYYQRYAACTERAGQLRAHPQAPLPQAARALSWTATDLAPLGGALCLGPRDPDELVTMLRARLLPADEQRALTELLGPPLRPAYRRWLGLPDDAARNPDSSMA